MSLPVYSFLSQDVLHGFKHNYKYSSIDDSPISMYVMQPLWDMLVKLYPKWVAPNLLTFTGFLFLAIQAIPFTIFDPSLDNGVEMPNWVWLFAGISIFIYYQCDSIDGKQARRTGCSSPLGELFDHGVDSLSTYFLPVPLFSAFVYPAFGAILPLQFNNLIILYSLQLPFISAHWEKYITGVLYLTWGYDIGMIGLSSLLVGVWYYGVHNVIREPIIGSSISFGTMFILVWFVLAFVSVGISVYNVLQAANKKTARHFENLYEALLPLFSIATLFALVTIWAIYSPGDILTNQGRWLLTLHGFVFSNIVARLLVNQMSITRCEPWNAFVTILTIGLAILTSGVYLYGPNQPLILLYERFFLKSMTICVVIGHFYYGYSVVNQMANFLKISVFKVKSN